MGAQTFRAKRARSWLAFSSRGRVSSPPVRGFFRRWETQPLPATRKAHRSPRLLGALLAVACTLSASARAEEARSAELRGEFVERWLDTHLEEIVELYEELHAHPELSLQETQTAARVAEGLEEAGYAVSRGVGGNGVVGVLDNGAGPTLMIRGDMDALPVTEETGLDYASRVRVTLPDGRSSGVMHACGHDIHTANLLASARLLADARDLWTGTLVIVAQPAEEIGRGASDMLGDGLFRRFPRPDITLALHVESSLPAGSLGAVSGWAMANVDSVDVHFVGRGGHGARPHQAVDPIVAASHFVTALQTLVSRRVDPQQAAVVTVGSFHAGSKRNVIPDEAHLQLTVRSYTDEVRGQLLEGIEQLARDTCQLFQCPEPARVEAKELYTPAVYNDPALSARALELFREIFGAANVLKRPPSMGGEDFGRYARELGVPGLLFRVGAQPEAAWRASQKADADPLPSLHSSRFAPDPAPTLATALQATTRLSLSLLQLQ